jgi:predicted CXXCH cytochrome family protein
MALTGKRGKGILIATIMCILSGCDPLTRHKIATTIFDGVPSLPPADQYCQEFHIQSVAEEQEAKVKKKAKSQLETASSHPPYAEKRCDGCHDKNTDSGFVVPRAELCAVCHQNFLKGELGHGPAVVGACLSCHVPHDSKYPRLLKKPVNELCVSCHLEGRLSKNLHDNVSSKGLICTDCHDPHSGNTKFFLK